MKKLRLGLLMLAVLARYLVQAEGTTYLSNLGAPSTGSYSVASNSWLAVRFFTGSNPAGYLLNSVELAMLNAIGSPSSFALSVYRPSPFGPIPYSSFSPLLGSTDPASPGIYSFSAPSNLTLLPNRTYFIVLSAGTATNVGAYQWSTTATSPNLPGSDWQGGAVWFSPDGLPPNWNVIPGNGQFALNATPVPEPSTLSLLAIVGLPAFILRSFRQRRTP